MLPQPCGQGAKRGGGRTKRVVLAVAVSLLPVLVPACASAGVEPGPRVTARSAATPGTALLGSTAIQPSRARIAAGRVEAFRVSARRAGVADSVQIYVDAGTTARVLGVGLYADRRNSPGSRLVSGSLRAPRVGGWDTVPLSAARRLVAGRTYWLSISARGGPLHYRSRRRACASATAIARGWGHARKAGRFNCLVSAFALESGSAQQGPLPAPGAQSEAPPGAPAITSLPAISGSPIEGQTLKATSGTWSGKPTSYSYQWQDCNRAGASCAKISGAHSASYVLRASDVGARITVTVTASNAIGSTQASSAVNRGQGAGPARSGQLLIPDDQRCHRRRSDADCRSGKLDGKPNLVHLPMGALQRGGFRLQ